MALGQKMGSLKALKQSMAKGSGGAFIKYIPKNGSMNVRFIQEPEEWVNYVEHFDQMLRKSYPCNGEANCPGCASGERKSSRYLANAVDRDDKDRVIPLQMPKDLANRLVVRYERNGTLTDRDFELSRSGEGLDTVYDLDAGVVDRAKIDKFQPHDLLKVLEDAYNNVFGPADAEEEEVKAGPVKARGRSSAAAAAAPSTYDGPPAEDDEDAPVPTKAPARKRTPAKKAAATKPEPEFDPDDDKDDEPDVPVADADDATDPVADVPVEAEPEADEDDADEGYDEETLRAMPLGALRAVARNEFGVATKGMSQDALIEAIFAAGDEDGDDEPPF